MHHDAGDVVGGEPVRVSFDPDEPEAVRRVSRFEPVTLATRRHDVIDLADRERRAVGVVAAGEMFLRDVATGVERLAVHEGQLGAGRPQVGESYPPVDVLAEVDDLATGVDAADVDGPHLLDAPHRRRRRGGERRTIVVGDGDRVPDRGPQASVFTLAGHQVGGDDRTGRRPPALVGGDDAVAAVQLAQEGHGVAVAVGYLPEPGTPAVPAVAQHRGPDVLAGNEEAGDRVGLHVETRLVRRESRGELEITDPLPVEERLVATVRRRIEASVRRDGVKVETAPQHERRTPAGAGAHRFVRFDPLGDPVRSIEEAHLEPRCFGPLAPAEVGPDLDPPTDALPTGERFTRPWRQHAVS